MTSTTRRPRLVAAIGAFAGAALLCAVALVLRGPWTDPVATHARTGGPASAEADLEKAMPLSRAQRRTIEYDWVVTSVWDRRPDCMLVDERWPRRVLLVNGEHIGPSVNVTRGDIVKIKVTNMIETRDFGHNEMHGITIHWHGLKQRSGTQWSDGVGWLTQCPIGYNQSYTYVMDTAEDSVGTHWWHAHTGSDNADGMYGAFIVREPPNRRLPKQYQYDEDLPPLFVQGWWNYSAPSLEWGLQQAELRWVANAQSILMNGKGVCGPSLDTRHEPGNTAGCDLDSLDTWYTYDIQPGKTYRLRVIGAGTLLPINITMPGHRMTIVEADGAYVEPIEVDELLVNLGQRYSVLFTADQPVANYEIVASVYGRQARSGQCAVEYRKSFDYEWEEGTFSTTQSCGGLDPAKVGVDEARKAALEGASIETNYRLPMGLAVLHYDGAPHSLADDLFAGPWGSAEEKLRALTINWVQNLTIVERDALSERVATFENKLRSKTSLNNYDATQRLPTPRGPVPRIEMALATWWPGKLPQQWHDDGLPGYITAPSISEKPDVRAGALPVYKWAVNNVTQAFGYKRGEYKSQALPVSTQWYAKTVSGYDITPDYETWPPPGAPNPTYTLGVFGWKIPYGSIVDFIIYNDDLAEEHPWHMHGYCFHVLGHGLGKYDDSRDRGRLNTRNPVCRDTTQVLPNTWAYIRVHFDNPGVWYFHCHMDWHLELGLGALMMVKEGSLSTQKKMPKPARLDDYRMCNGVVSSDWNADGYPKIGTGGWTGLDKKAPGSAPGMWREFGDIQTYDQIIAGSQKDALKQAPPPSHDSHGRRRRRHGRHH